MNKKRLLTLMGGTQKRYVTLPQNMLTVAEVTLLDFEDFDNYVSSGTGTIEDNATQFLDGTHSIKFSPGTGSVVRATKGSLSLDLSTYKSYIVRCYIHSGSLSTTGYAASLLITGAGMSAGHNGIHGFVDITGAWYPVMFNESGFTDAIDTTCTSIRLAVTDTLSNDIVASLDKLTACAGYPAVMIMFDDQYASFYENAYPYMQSRGIKGTMYVLQNNVDAEGYMTSAQLVELDRVGWDCANHTQSHLNMATSEQATIEAELSGCETFLNNLGLTRASKHVGYPGNAIGTNGLAAMTATGMITGRFGSRDNFVLPGVDLYGIPSYSMKVKTPTQIKADIDRAIADNTICALYFHSIVDTVVDADIEYSTADFKEIIDYIVEKKIQPITISQLYDTLSGDVSVQVPKSF